MKKLFYIVLFFLLALFLLYNFLLPVPTPDSQRNQTINGVRLDAKIGSDTRKPIIKTLALKDYKNRNEKAKKKIEDFVDGRVEGDIPCLHLLEDNHLYFFFTNRSKAVTFPTDSPPKIEIYPAITYMDEDKSQIIIKDSLKQNKDGQYYFPMQRYKVQYERYFIDYHLIKVYYTIDGDEYISLMGIYMDNYPAGQTPFDENETLDPPLPAQIPTT